MENATEKQTDLMNKLGVIVPSGCSKQHAAELISEKLGKPLLNQLPKPARQFKPTDNSSYYVAYAKDILISLINGGMVCLKDGEEKEALTFYMSQCIDVIKTAKQEFENDT